MSFYRIARALVAVWAHIAYRITVEGRENVPQGGGYLVCANHLSAADPIFIAISMKPEISYMGKAELFRNPFFGMVLRWLHVFPVQRGRGDTGAIDHAIETIRTGGVLGIFPEGTRSKDGEPLRPKSGMAVIARASKGDILPVGIQFADRHRWRSRVYIRIGTLIPCEALGFETGSPREIKAASRMIMEKIAVLAGVAKNEDHAG